MIRKKSIKKMSERDLKPVDGIPCHGEGGFSMIETISVLVILSIIAATALVRLPSLTDHTRRLEIDTLKSHLRFVQAQAMGTHTPWSVRFIDSTTYRFLENGVNCQCAPPGADIIDSRMNPDNDSLTVNLVSLSIDTDLGTGLSDRINFDKMGSPVADDGETELAADIPVLDTDGAALFTVTAYTGFIE